MQNLVFLACFFSKVIEEKHSGGIGSTPPPPSPIPLALGKRRVKHTPKCRLGVCLICFREVL